MRRMVIPSLFGIVALSSAAMPLPSGRLTQGVRSRYQEPSHRCAAPRSKGRHCTSLRRGRR